MSSDIPARIREIVTQSMSPTENEKEEASILVEENKKLKLELDSVEEKLSSIRHDRQRFTLNSPKLKVRILCYRILIQKGFRLNFNTSIIRFS